MRIENGTTSTNETTTTRADAADTAVDSEFKTMFRSKVQQLWTDYQETGLTAADQQIQAAGGDELLRYKQELDRKKRSSHDGSATAVATETIRKYMPDGSILIITTKNGKITEQYRKKPHMVFVPDPIQPPKPEGSGAASAQIKMKQVPRRNLLED